MAPFKVSDETLQSLVQRLMDNRNRFGEKLGEYREPWDSDVLDIVFGWNDYLPNNIESEEYILYIFATCLYEWKEKLLNIKFINLKDNLVNKINIPPGRMRAEDIQAIIEFFNSAYVTVLRETVDHLLKITQKLNNSYNNNKNNQQIENNTLTREDMEFVHYVFKTLYTKDEHHNNIDYNLIIHMISLAIYDWSKKDLQLDTFEFIVNDYTPNMSNKDYGIFTIKQMKEIRKFFGKIKETYVDIHGLSSDEYPQLNTQYLPLNSNNGNNSGYNSNTSVAPYKYVLPPVNNNGSNGTYNNNYGSYNNNYEGGKRKYKRGSQLRKSRKSSKMSKRKTRSRK